MIGVKVRLRTKEYEIPSLTFAEVEQFIADETLNRIPSPDSAGMGLLVAPVREATMTVLLAALRHNYPEIAKEELASELDMENASRAVAALMGASKLERKEPGAGEA